MRIFTVSITVPSVHNTFYYSRTVSRELSSVSSVRPQDAVADGAGPSAGSMPVQREEASPNYIDR